MYLEVLLQVALLSELHATALLLAQEWFILGVAPEMGEKLAHGRNYALAALKVACENFELTL